MSNSFYLQPKTSKLHGCICITQKQYSKLVISVPFGMEFKKKMEYFNNFTISTAKTNLEGIIFKGTHKL